MGENLAATRWHALAVVILLLANIATAQDGNGNSLASAGRRSLNADRNRLADAALQSNKQAKEAVDTLVANTLEANDRKFKISEALNEFRAEAARLQDFYSEGSHRLQEITCGETERDKVLCLLHHTLVRLFNAFVLAMTKMRNQLLDEPLPDSEIQDPKSLLVAASLACIPPAKVEAIKVRLVDPTNPKLAWRSSVVQEPTATPPVFASLLVSGHGLDDDGVELARFRTITLTTFQVGEPPMVEPLAQGTIFKVTLHLFQLAQVTKPLGATAIKFDSLLFSYDESKPVPCASLDLQGHPRTELEE